MSDDLEKSVAAEAEANVAPVENGVAPSGEVQAQATESAPSPTDATQEMAATTPEATNGLSPQAQLASETLLKTISPIVDSEMNEWIEKSDPEDLLVLPFDHVPHVSDQYELALINLYKKSWTFRKITFVHFFFIAPLMELPLALPRLISKKFCLIRFLTILFSLLAGFSMLYWSLKAVNYSILFPTLSAILAGSLATLHFTLAWDRFYYWREAYAHIDHGLLRDLLPEKPRPTKKS
jgi:hypothetical protein